MERKEFNAVMSVWENFYALLDTVNLDTGQNIYHKCKLCSYKTKIINNLGEAEIDKIDSAAISHVWEHHRENAEKLAVEYMSRKVAKVMGQQRLQI